MSDGYILKLKVRDPSVMWEEVPRTLRSMRGVVRVDTNASRELIRVVSTRPIAEREVLALLPSAPPQPANTTERPSWFRILGLFGLVLFLGVIATRSGWLSPNVAIGSGISFSAVFLIGLLAGASTCIAVSGGLMLGVIARTKARMRTMILFVGGRLASYAILGGVIGGLGKALSPPPAVIGTITVIAALAMLVMGLKMLHLAPRWIDRFMPRMPKWIGHKVMDQEEKTHALAPFILGAGTFFLPCGFTQALQLYALTTGSATTSAMLLFGFALGTAPALILLGWASNSLRGSAGKLFMQFAGALVVVLGFWNVQNGFAIAGVPLGIPRLRLSESAAAGSESVTYNGKEQIVDITVDQNGYTPADFTLRRGVPTRMRVSGPAAGQGCLAILQIPKLGIRERLNPASTTEISFTPNDPGRYTFSCSMGMYRGTFDVL